LRHVLAQDGPGRLAMGDALGYDATSPGSQQWL